MIGRSTFRRADVYSRCASSSRFNSCYARQITFLRPIIRTSSEDIHRGVTHLGLTSIRPC
jgi:hypothetical protein